MFGIKNNILTDETVALILSNLKDAVLVLSADSRILWANKKIMDLTGLKENKLIGGYCYKVLHHFDKPCKPTQNICPVREVLKTGRPIIDTHCHFDKQGNKFYSEVSAFPARNKRGKITQFVHISRDVTAKIKLAEAAQYTESILANMPDTLIVFTPRGNIKSVNKATCDLLGYAEAELVGKPVAAIFEEELFKGMNLRKLIEEGSVRDFDMTYKTKSGAKIPVSFSGSVMYETRVDADKDAIRATNH